MNKDDGGPAFPFESKDKYGANIRATTPGMSLRDWFAGQALTGVLADMEMSAYAKAIYAYEIADAMLAERNK
jgi:hypothetical protein